MPNAGIISISRLRNKEHLPVNTSFIAYRFINLHLPILFLSNDTLLSKKTKRISKCTDPLPVHHQAGLPSSKIKRTDHLQAHHLAGRLNSKMRPTIIPLRITIGRNKCLIRRCYRLRRPCRDLILRRGMPRVTMLVVPLFFV